MFLEGPFYYFFSKITWVIFSKILFQKWYLTLMVQDCNDNVLSPFISKIHSSSNYIFLLWFKSLKVQKIIGPHFSNSIKYSRLKTAAKVLARKTNEKSGMPSRFVVLLTLDVSVSRNVKRPKWFILTNIKSIFMKSLAFLFLINF